VKDCSDDSATYKDNPYIARCPTTSRLAMILFFIYILMTSIMLVNLLIAIFRFCSIQFFSILRVCANC